MKQLWKQLIATCLLLVSTITHAGWTVRYQHTDTLGSVIAQSNDQGTISQRFDYKPFGEGTPTQKSGLGYTGHLEDTDLGLTYMQQRYYDPVVGRFYSNDPMGFTGEVESFNRYSYVGNNPYKYNDPTGMERQSSYEQCEQDSNCENVLPKHAQAAYGEVRSHSIQGKAGKYEAPEGLADAVVSIGAVCGRSGGRCNYVDGSNAAAFLDRKAWANILNVKGGKDLTGGGTIMCVGTQKCYQVHSAYIRNESGGSELVKRAQALKPSGIITLKGTNGGELNIYFYILPFNGWMTQKDYIGPIKKK